MGGDVGFRGSKYSLSVGGYRHGCMMLICFICCGYIPLWLGVDLHPPQLVSYSLDIWFSGFLEVKNGLLQKERVHDEGAEKLLRLSMHTGVLAMVLMIVVRISAAGCPVSNMN
jgi:hypothetical protein